MNNDSDDEGYVYVYKPRIRNSDIFNELKLNSNTFQRIKHDDPTIVALRIALDREYNYQEGCSKNFFNSIDWNEDGDYISNNTQLKTIRITHMGNQHGITYCLGEEGNDLPTKQQLQAFFSCIYQNSYINELAIHKIGLLGDFSAGLIEGLCGHDSLTRLEIRGAKLGDLVYSALGRVLKDPKSKLKDLQLSACELNDEGLRILCDGLLGNSTITSLNLDFSDQITSVGWQALMTVIRHPNCKLTDLSLNYTSINDDYVNILGRNLSSLVKTLNFRGRYKKFISSSGWHTFFHQLSQNITSLELSDNSIDDTGLARLAVMGGNLKHLNLSYNHSITPTGWRSFFNSVQTRGFQLAKLEIRCNRVGYEGAAALGSLLSNMSALKELDMYNMSRCGEQEDITPQGWRVIFTALQGGNLDLVKLILCGNDIDDEGIQLLVPLVSRMSWQALTGYLQSPNFGLREFFLVENNVDDDTLIAYSNALVQNSTLTFLNLDACVDIDEDEDDDDDDLITDRSWEAFSTLVCNKTSIMDTYNSNHTLRDLCDDIPDYLESYLELNKNEDKTEVARQKILQTHFSTCDSTNIQELLDMELEMMPAAISWIGRPTYANWRGTSMTGLTLMYNLMRRLPDLFDTDAHTKKKSSSVAKRKREM